MSAVSVEAVSKAMGALLEREGRTVIYQDRASGEDLAVTPASAAAPNGLLPALVVAGEAVWREATGQGFALDIVRDPAALLGYRLRAIRDGQFSTVMLATMEAAAQVAQPGAIVVNGNYSGATRSLIGGLLLPTYISVRQAAGKAQNVFIQGTLT